VAGEGTGRLSLLRSVDRPSAQQYALDGEAAKPRKLGRAVSGAVSGRSRRAEVERHLNDTSANPLSRPSRSLKSPLPRRFDPRPIA